MSGTWCVTGPTPQESHGRLGISSLDVSPDGNVKWGNDENGIWNMGYFWWDMNHTDDGISNNIQVTWCYDGIWNMGMWNEGMWHGMAWWIYGADVIRSVCFPGYVIAAKYDQYGFKSCLLQQKQYQVCPTTCIIFLGTVLWTILFVCILSHTS